MCRLERATYRLPMVRREVKIAAQRLRAEEAIVAKLTEEIATKKERLIKVQSEGGCRSMQPEAAEALGGLCVCAKGERF
jgi:hypothetical protein